MKVLSAIIIPLVILVAVVVVASGYLGAALGIGWIVRRLLSVDLFQGTLLALVALGGAVAMVLRIGNALVAYDDRTRAQPEEQDDDVEAYDDDTDDDADDAAERLPSSRDEAVRGVVAFVDTGRLRNQSAGRGKSRKSRRRH